MRTLIAVLVGTAMLGLGGQSIAHSPEKGETSHTAGESWHI